MSLQSRESLQTLYTQEEPVSLYGEPVAGGGSPLNFWNILTQESTNIDLRSAILLF